MLTLTGPSKYFSWEKGVDLIKIPSDLSSRYLTPQTDHSTVCHVHMHTQTISQHLVHY